MQAVSTEVATTRHTTISRWASTTWRQSVGQGWMTHRRRWRRRRWRMSLRVACERCSPRETDDLCACWSVPIRTRVRHHGYCLEVQGVGIQMQIWLHTFLVYPYPYRAPRPLPGRRGCIPFWIRIRNHDHFLGSGWCGLGGCEEGRGWSGWVGVGGVWVCVVVSTPNSCWPSSAPKNSPAQGTANPDSAALCGPILASRIFD